MSDEGKYKNLLTSTTIIPLWAKAVESLEREPILRDDSALEILQKLGYSLDYYDKRKQNPSQVGCCLRAKWIDDETLRFVSENPHCQVIQLGAGLDDRFRRIGMPEGVSRWYDLDLEEVIALRRKTLSEAERNEFVAMNLFDNDWMCRLGNAHQPLLIILEGVMMFLSKEQIQQLVADIHRYFERVVVLFDAVPSAMVGRAKYHDSVKKYNSKVEYLWGIKQEEDVEKVSPHLSVEKFVRMSDLPKSERFCLPLRLCYKIPYFYKRFNQILVKVVIE